MDGPPSPDPSAGRICPHSAPPLCYSLASFTNYTIYLHFKVSAANQGVTFLERFVEGMSGLWEAAAGLLAGLAVVGRFRRTIRERGGF